MFQSKLVRGAVESFDLELDSSASGVSFWGCVCIEFDLVMVPDAGGLGDDAAFVFGNDQRRRWSPDVASKSVNGLLVVGGSHKILVIGYVCVASASFVNSIEG